MPRWFPLPPRIVEVEVPADDDQPDARNIAVAGGRLRHLVNLLLPTPARSGATVRPGPIAVDFAVGSGAAVTTAVDGTASTAAAAGATVATAVDGTPATVDARAGARLGRFRVDWERDAGADTVVQAAVNGRSDWQDVANAAGDPDGVTATIAGNALGARAGDLQFGFADFSGKDDLDLDQIRLVFHVAQAGTTLGNGDLQLRWRRTSSHPWEVLETITGNVDSLAGGRAFDLPDQALVSNLNGFQASVRFTADLGQIYTAQCDAVRLAADGHLEETP